MSHSCPPVKCLSHWLRAASDCLAFIVLIQADLRLGWACPGVNTKMDSVDLVQAESPTGVVSKWAAVFFCMATGDTGFLLSGETSDTMTLIIVNDGR